MSYTELHQQIREQGHQLEFATMCLRVCDGSLYVHHDVTQLPLANINPNALKQFLESRRSVHLFMKQPLWNGATWPNDPNTWHLPLWIPLLLLLIAPIRWLIAHSAITSAFPVINDAKQG